LETEKREIRKALKATLLSAQDESAADVAVLKAEHEREVADLTAKIKDLEEASDVQQASLEQSVRLNAEIEVLKAENAALKGRVRVATLEGQDADDLLRLNASLKKDLEALKLANVEQEKEIEAFKLAQIEYEDSQQKTQAELTRLMSENKVLRNDNSRLASALDETLKSATMKINAIRDENLSLKERLGRVFRADSPVKRSVSTDVIKAESIKASYVEPTQEVIQAEVNVAHLAALEPASGDEVKATKEATFELAQSQIEQDANSVPLDDMSQAQKYEAFVVRELLKQDKKNTGLEKIKEAAPMPDDQVLDAPEIAAPEPDEDDGNILSSITSMFDDDEEADSEELPELTVEDDGSLPDMDPTQQMQGQAIQQSPQNTEVQMSADPFEGINVADEDTVRSNAPAQEQSAAVTYQSQLQPAVPSRRVNGVSAALAAGNVVALDAVRRVDAGAGSVEAYQWRAGSVYGSGEQKILTSYGDFDRHVKEYLMRTQERCSGDFAILPDNSNESNRMRIESYEVACIGNGVNSSASLVFYNDGELFSVLAHEVSSEKMEDAMRIRDRIYQGLVSGSRS